MDKHIEVLEEMLSDWQAEVSAQRNLHYRERDHHFIGMRSHDIERLAAVIALMRGQAEPRGWISDNDLLKLRESVDDARNIRMSTKRTHLRVHPVHIPALATMKQEPADEQ